MNEHTWPGHVVRLNPAEQFFYNHAGSAHDPVHENATSGRTRGAVLLAAAEATAKRKGWIIQWELDADADNEPGPGYFVSGEPQWEATLYNNADGKGEFLAGLSAIDLGEEGLSNPYVRVVEAELASEALS